MATKISASSPCKTPLGLFVMQNTICPTGHLITCQNCSRFFLYSYFKTSVLHQRTSARMRIFTCHQSWPIKHLVYRYLAQLHGLESNKQGLVLACVSTIGSRRLLPLVTHHQIYIPRYLHPGSSEQRRNFLFGTYVQPSYSQGRLASTGEQGGEGEAKKNNICLAPEVTAFSSCVTGPFLMQSSAFTASFRAPPPPSH